MRHRHLNHEGFTLAAVDDVIGRGKLPDWIDLGRAAKADPDVMAKILRVCRVHCHDPYAQRYHLWRHYAEKHLA
jgi:hypothetical protein